MSRQPENWTIDHMTAFRVSVFSNTLGRAAARYSARHLDLSLTQWRVLAIVGMGAPATARDVVRKTGLDKGGISRAVADLLDRGLLEKQPSADDRRARPLSLTAKGRRLYDQGLRAASARNDALMAALTKRERRLWDDFLGRLQARAELLSGDEALQAVAPEGIP
jgi:DNA-binding MarR family transcriptional regulator